MFLGENTLLIMIDQKKILAIIPARGGSKRLPRKNILPIAGKPLIQWTIEASLDSKYIDSTFVSTIVSCCFLFIIISKAAKIQIAFQLPKTFKFIHMKIV